MEDKERLKPGDLVVFYKLPNSPLMTVKSLIREEKKEDDLKKSDILYKIKEMKFVTSTINDSGEEEYDSQYVNGTKLIGILCQWFDLNNVHREQIFSTKDLKKI